MFRELLVLLALSAVAMASMARSGLQEKPYKFRNVEGCYVDVLDEVIPFGESMTYKPYCTEFRCDSMGMDIATCGVVSNESTCRLVEDHSKSYPDCCPKIKCP